MPVITYKCPNCGGELIFDPKTQRYRCEYCMSAFSREEAEQANQKGSETGSDVDDAKTEQEEEETGAVVYTCPNCGAEIVTDETTAATECFYCHNPVVLSGRLSGAFRPDQVIPFAIDRKEATERFLAYIKKKRYIPRDFFSRHQVEKMTGVYFPYWLYSGDFQARYRARGKKVRVWRAGDVEYTETSIYEVERDGEIDLEGLSRNALKKADRDLIECVQPYKLADRKDFSMIYLSGFRAEKRDLEREMVKAQLEAERDSMAAGAIRGEAGGYASLDQESVQIRPKNEKWEYVLFPVWTLTYPGTDGKIYYYAMNGQTGRINGDFPVDRKKAAITSVVFGILVFMATLMGGYFL